ncbi:spermidine/putrescine ABC transporter substrate binding domain protein, partial [Chlamydia psittaci 02DC14]
PNNIKNRAHLIYQNEVDEKNKVNPIAYDADGDGKPDYFYEYLVPYFIQDKLIVYNTNTKYKPHLKDLDSIKADLNNK